MSEPTVACVMLTCNRDEMAERAAKAFHKQTYQNRHLIVWNVGQPMEPEDLGFGLSRVWYNEPDRLVITPRSIGELRNEAIRWISSGPTPYPEIIMHWDDDDWSHPLRIEEQVKFLVESGADCVGYNDMLFWHNPVPLYETKDEWGYVNRGFSLKGEAWLYRRKLENYAIGTSLCYWRSAWEKNPFEDLPKGPHSAGEDHMFMSKLNTKSCSSFDDGLREEVEPRMVASIHGGNSRIEAYKLLLGNPQNRDVCYRVPGWDKYCAEAFSK